LFKGKFLSIYDAYILLVLQMEQVDIITVKVPCELKKKMKQVNVNWSEYIRESIKRKIDEQKLKDASAKLDEIRLRAKPVSTEELVSWIREDRER
jgi:hypothetical protein